MERLLDYFVPERYKLDIGVDKKNKKIGGRVEIIGEAKAEIVKFHATGLEVTGVIMNGEKWDYDLTDGVLTLEKVPRGDVTVGVQYVGRLNENMQGAYLSTYEYEGTTEVIVATQFESHYAREAFPCIDEPGAKAVFELTLTVPEVGDLVLANMPLQKIKKYGKVPDGKFAVFYDDDGKKSAGQYVQYEFQPTPRMSTYLLAWVVGRLHGKTITNEHGVEITTYVALNQDIDAVDYANEIAARSLEFYDDNFGVPYPLSKLTQVALPDFEAGAMENWGLVTYRETALLVGKNATLGSKKGVALTVAHELSHQWFGDLVTMAWWDDLWLNESFASVMEYYAVDFIHPEYKIFEGFFTGDAVAALKRDAYAGVQSVHQEVKEPAEIATLFDPAIVYAKGARLMLMLIREMGWTGFSAGIRDYFETYKYSNTVGDDLWRALRPYATFDPYELMHAFIDQPGYPVVKSEETDFVKWSQKRFLLDGEMHESNWPLAEIREDMTGHYILNLTDRQFAERLGRFDKMGLEEKLRLLIDRSLVTKTELASSASLLALAQKFRDENSAAVWRMVADLISGLMVFFEPESAEEKKFKRFVGKLVRGKLAEVGQTTREGDDENTLRLRANLLALDYYAEDEENLAKLAKKYSGDYAELDAEVRDNILDAKIYFAPEVLDTYIEAYKATADPDMKFDFLFSATTTRDTGNLEKLMALLEQPDVVKPQDQLYLFVSLYRNPKSKEKAFDWLTCHWNYVKTLAGDKSLDSYPRYIANLVRTEAEFKKYLDFFGPMRDDPALARAIEIGEQEIRARLKLIAMDQEGVYKELEKLV